MKNLIKLLLTFLLSILFGFTSVFAAGIDHFEVTLNPETAKVGEALDLTIKAVDKNNIVIKNYVGSILLFSESDPEATLPSALEDNTYTYKLSDEGIVKFENAVKFKAKGTQNINVYDYDDDTIFGIAETTISEATIIQNIDISIVSPQNGLTIGENKINISGTTQKNHQIKILINNSKAIKTTSNSEGTFEIEAKNLVDGDNLIIAKVLDADGNIIGESTQVSIKVDINNLNIKNIKVTPQTVDPENSYEVEVIANPKLTKVQIIVNDILTNLEETKDGVYTAKLYAPKEAGVYKIDARIVDELGHDKTELGIESITVNKVVLASATETIPTTTTEKISTTMEDIPTINKNNNTNTKKELKISGLKLVELKTKSILTWNKVDGAISYNIYKKYINGNLELITNIKENTYDIPMKTDEVTYDYFAVKAVSQTDKGEIYEGTLSDATKVKTGPEVIILFLLSLLIGGVILVIKQKKA